MAVTAHWMAENDGHLELKSALIAFQRVWGKHSAKNLANIMLRVLDRAGTTNKVSISASVFLTHSFVYFFFQDGTHHHGQSRNKHESHGRIGQPSLRS